MAAKKTEFTFDKEAFANPPRSMRVRPMTHSLPEDMDAFLAQYEANGYGGGVINVPFENGFTSNPDNLARFGKIIEKMKAHGLDYWIYDEPGYPSGQAGGLTLEGHPEWQMKGLYMHRRAAYEDTHVCFRLDDESEKIVFASIYPVDTSVTHQSYVQFGEMRAVPFSKKTVTCDLHASEVLYIFCVRNAHEGTQSTHNTCSFRRNVNIMSKAAIRHFIDVAYEPIAKALPEAYPGAGNVFTDEPSLMVNYVRDYESYNYAMIPWIDGFFTRYQKTYGEPLTPDLPLLFEGWTTREAGGMHNRAYAVRVKYWHLVSELCGEAYSGQLAAWCEKHGSGFSGHYLAEEALRNHVYSYGDYINVVKRASYPGCDILNCVPRLYRPNTAKFTQTASRKRGTDGTMVEICPFGAMEEFEQDPADNILGIVGMLAMDGVRQFNSYHRPLSPTPTNAKEEAEVQRDEAYVYNMTVGRLNVMLRGKRNDTHTLVYYPIEDTQAKAKPSYTSDCGNGADTDDKLNRVVGALYAHGLDFYYADADDLVLAANDKKTTGFPKLYGIPVETVIIPEITVMHRRALEALERLRQRGVKVTFIGRAVPMTAEDAADAAPLTANIPVTDMAAIVAALEAEDVTVVPTEKNADSTLHFARYRTQGGYLYLVCNTGDTERSLTVNAREATLLFPVSGEIREMGQEKTFMLPRKRCVFVSVDKK